MLHYLRKRVMQIIALFLIIVWAFLQHSAIAIASPAITENPEIDQTIWPAGPEVYADSAIVMEASTGLILYEKDIHTSYYPASITKILTTLLAIENSALNEIITVSYEAEWYVSKNSSRMGLVEGEQLTMEDALYGIMLESANEATYAVGEHISGSIAKFIKLMNTKAKELGCKNTNFENSHGLHDDNHYTSSYDMALIGKAAMDNPTFRKITGTSTYAMPATNKTDARLLSNHHKFILKTMKYDYAIGGKTGATAKALNTLVTFAKKDGMTLIAVVMHVDTVDHTYSDTANILNFAFDNYSMHNIEETEIAMASTFPSMFDNTTEFKKDETKLLRINENGNVILPNGIPYKEAKKEISFHSVDELVHGDNIIGSILYTFGGRTVGNANLLYYNSGTPMTAELFASKWPQFMIPIDAVFTDEINPLPELDKSPATQGSLHFLPLVLGIGVGIIALIVGLILVFRKSKLY